MAPTDSDEDPLYDVIIVGAGPSGLAVAARLRERTPSAIFTDEEHQRYHWIKQHRTSIKSQKTGRVRTAARGPDNQRYSMLVLDATGDEWLARWKQLFRVLRIEELRSPSFFHVDPSDRDALLAYAHENGRMEEMEAIRGVVGKEVSKHGKKMRTRKQPREPLINERDRSDYFNPSARLFDGHCKQCIERYSLSEGLIRKEAVQDLQYGDFPDSSNPHEIFRVQTNTHRYFARTVVLAIGAANAPSIPGHLSNAPVPGACHAMQIKQCPPPDVEAKLRDGKSVNVLVVGGGLTSAQVSDLAIQRGVTKVWHIMRGSLKVKPFDLDLPWLGKFKNEKQAEFWTADTDEERLEMIQIARGGGSITPKYRKILEHHVKRGRVSLHTHTSLVSKSWDESTRSWCVETQPLIADLPSMDYIYFATGIRTDVRELAILSTMLKDFPIKDACGLPCINEDLMWRNGVPLFINGKLASMQVGPGAANLSGARVGAERIAWGVEEVLRSQGTVENYEGLGGGLDLVRTNRFIGLEQA